MEKYKCEDCKDTGWVNENGAGFHGESMPCDCRKKSEVNVEAVVSFAEPTQFQNIQFCFILNDELIVTEGHYHGIFYYSDKYGYRNKEEIIKWIPLKARSNQQSGG